MKVTAEGFEEHAAVNFLAPSLLTLLMLPALKQAGEARVINVNSIVGHPLLWGRGETDSQPDSPLHAPPS